ncbi:MAG: transcription-repair coupling factor [Erysipelotrichales bacterium]|nr:transcription-repair coupling factor [Erysipelotrichales bacterium]
MSDLISILKDYQAIQKYIDGTCKEFVTDDVVGTSLLVCAKYENKPCKIAIITSNLYNAQRTYDFISNIIGEENCLFYPVDEMLRSESLAVSKEMIAQRIYILNELRNRENYVLVTHASAIMKYLPSPETFDLYTLKFGVGEKIDLLDIKQKLVNMGYTNVHKIDHSLQFASRGDILDIFSVNCDYPIRIELFDDEIESIRYFSLDNQSSFQAINNISVLPATELLFTQNELDDIGKKMLFQADLEKKQLSTNLIDCFNGAIKEAVEDIKINKNIQKTQKYYSFLQSHHYSLIDYTKDSEIVLANEEQVIASSRLLFDEATNYLMSEYKSGKSLLAISIYQNFEEIIKKCKNKVNVHEFGNKKDSELLQISSIAGAAINLNQAFDMINKYIYTGNKVIVSLDNKQQFELICSSLETNNIEYDKLNNFKIPKKQVGVMIGLLDEGFELIKGQLVFLTSKELFSFKIKNSKFTNRFKEAIALKSEQDLEPGDYVVHEQHGVGRFIDIVTMEIDKIHRDFIHIQYAGTDVLYVPLEQFRLIKKFSGREGVAPKLNKLGSNDWEKTKKKIKERINDMADRLFKLYSDREQVKGFAFEKDDEIQYEFEQQFPHALTPDQERCLREIKKDMESSKPMDRLLCGDVGFGKTEIAFRAAFKAILSGKQVAILCPTTLLARQHYERAKERFGAFDVKIAVFSRLVDESKQKYFQKVVEDGSVHLIIGTHRILSKELKFKNLGLLIVDEEQRFGVEQKERIKELKTNIDVLTLTATPIPRTLQMSLLGIRSLSQINTPPESRIPIQTYVIPQKDDVVYELISRELSRKGQVFYLHNNVSTIYSKALKIEKAIKGCRVGVAHGQMDRDSIEDIMLNFYNGDIDVLVCTSIIETGIDIPNVNMIIIEDADKFGLAQLYQIKGRVGRGDKIAYAYLLYKQNKVLNEKAQKRLKAITDFTELGSGYKIAQRDLLIRGAGDILGPEQAGFIDTVGIDMYMTLLQETISEKTTGIISSKKESKGNVAVDAYLPNEYVDKIDKIDLYQEIDNVKSLDELNVLKEKVRDIYGRLPNSVKLLFDKRQMLFVIDNDSAFDTLIEQHDFVDLLLSKEFSNIDGIGVYLFKMLSDFLRYIKVTYREKQIRIRLTKSDKWFEQLQTIIQIVSDLRKNIANQ